METIFLFIQLYSEAKSSRRGRAYRSREDLHSDTDVIWLDR